MTERLRQIMCELFPNNGHHKYTALWRVAAANGFPTDHINKPGENRSHQIIPQETVNILQKLNEKDLELLFANARLKNVGGLPRLRPEITQKYLQALQSCSSDTD
ncbi:hypothetical protein A2574_01545 [Candidatus Shapirobacteria bacterium RIFOXYD1_FULL_38_32]|nr:MAG: hypothetical protein A2410_03770 [Candidatus Shapirobacteria bacterium RIFOXYC1_FULL_38_24]OGL58013.1 MAG: hypothetical protein A2574_01545 [Candidatus Shapirobacteria bacterium RIFOXYD1_FULL_38_32]HAP37320.1 hypothetical protein [Candidatus Shapirobacteria bacterium]HCU55690.1 hypothetical protein [Candidatus Shapirobacteria bacterium]